MYTDEEIKMETPNTKKNNNYIYIIMVIALVCMFFIIISGNNTTPKSNITLNLQDGDITLQYNEEYKEPGYSCFDGNNDITSMVEVSNNIKINTPGEYKVYYKYKDKLVVRNVTVLEPSNYDLVINYELEKQEYTNQNMLVNYTIIGDTLSEVILPDGKIVKNSTGSFVVSENGKYILKAYNVRRDLYTKEIVIENIDKEKPSGTCSATVNSDNTIINVLATDNLGISKYEYYDNGKLLYSDINSDYTTTTSTSNIIVVKIIDNAGNYSEIKCNTTEKKTYDPIKPLAGEDIKFQEETDTLKVYITKNSAYYLTRIWVKDGYSQLNKAASPEYGSKLYYPKALINKEIEKNNLQNKLVLGFNASGFYLAGSYDGPSINAYPAYNKTEVGSLVINNGLVFRNAYDHAVKQWYLAGINKENKLVIFEDNVAKTAEEISNKQKWAQTVIDSGIRNTFSFAGPVIQNGQKLTKFSSSMPDPGNNVVKKLQMICQINENNYVLFTSTNYNRNDAINVFLKLGCQIATNLDGGGSLNLYYKSKKSKEFTSVVGNEREFPAAGYFTE